MNYMLGRPGGWGENISSPHEWRARVNRIRGKIANVLIFGRQDVNAIMREVTSFMASFHLLPFLQSAWQFIATDSHCHQTSHNEHSVDIFPSFFFSLLVSLIHRRVVRSSFMPAPVLNITSEWRKINIRVVKPFYCLKSKIISPLMNARFKTRRRQKKERGKTERRNKYHK